jgi:hypothetical protein
VIFISDYIGIRVSVANIVLDSKLKVNGYVIIIPTKKRLP